MDTESSTVTELSENDSIHFEVKDEDSCDNAASPSLLGTYSTASTIEILPSSENKYTNGVTAVVKCHSDTARSPSPPIFDVPVKTKHVKPANDSGSDSSTSPAVQQKQLRERCMYGASCYRKNPAHKQQYSHPNDIDWGADEKAPCPLGASCKKKDLRHLRDHSHPAAKKNKGKKRKQPADQDSSTDDDDSTNAGSENEDKLSQPNNILTTKRVRKTVQQQPQLEDNESDSENSSASEVDPFLTDGSDNGGGSWKGTSDDGDTD